MLRPAPDPSHSLQRLFLFCGCPSSYPPATGPLHMQPLGLFPCSHLLIHTYSFCACSGSLPQGTPPLREALLDLCSDSTTPLTSLQAPGLLFLQSEALAKVLHDAEVSALERSVPSAPLPVPSCACSWHGSWHLVDTQ